MLLFTDSTVQGGGFTVSQAEHMVSPESKARFPGQWYDKDTEVTDSGGNVLYAGLSYNWHRFYDAEVGRYITPDPIGLAGGMNVYAYADGNPVNATDFLGLAAAVPFGPMDSYNRTIMQGGALAVFLVTVMASNSGGPLITPMIDGDDQGEDQNGCRNRRIYPGLPLIGGMAKKLVGGMANRAASRSATGTMFRRSKNVGEFADLAVPMQMRYVKAIAEEAGVGLKGVKVKIVRQPELVGSGFLASTDIAGKTISLYPDSFKNLETMVKTLGHERTHIMQRRIFGQGTTPDFMIKMEKAAYGIENEFWKYYLKNMSGKLEKFR